MGLSYHPAPRGTTFPASEIAFTGLAQGGCPARVRITLNNRNVFSVGRSFALLPQDKRRTRLVECRPAECAIFRWLLRNDDNRFEPKMKKSSFEQLPDEARLRALRAGAMTGEQSK